MVELKDSLIIEDNPQILNFRFKFSNILMWPFIRVALHRIPLFREYKFLYPGLVQEKQSLINILLYFKNTIKNNPYMKSEKTKYDILMFCSGITNIKKRDKYFNRITDYFAFLNKNETLLIEDSTRRKYYTPRVFPNICYHDYIKLVASVKSRFVDVNGKDVNTIKKLLKFLSQKYPYKFEKLDLWRIENFLLRISKRLNTYHYLYSKLFDKFNPKIIFLEDASYGEKSYILKWAKARNIITVEPQHGIVSKNHEAYNYGNAIINSPEYRLYLPDYFLTYGKYWNASINLPVKKINVGNPNYSENIKKTNFRKISKKKIEILIISGAIDPDVIENITLEVNSLVDKSKYDITFRPHPCELHILKDRYSEILARNTIKIDLKTDLYSSLFNADFVVGYSSTVLFEAIGICKAIFAIEHPTTNLHIPKNIIKRISSAEELISLIQKNDVKNEIDKNYIWEPNWKDNYNNFIRSILKNR